MKWKMFRLGLLLNLAVTFVLGGTKEDLLNLFGDLAQNIANPCQYTDCEAFPKCPYGLEELAKTREGCSNLKERKYCCRPGSNPDCYHTSCGTDKSCKQGYRELDRDRTGCRMFDSKAYCCKFGRLPYCYDLSCPKGSQKKKQCPPEYSKVRSVKGSSSGCSSPFVERITCCAQFQHSQNGSNKTENVNNFSETISKTKTEVLENGTTIIRTTSTTSTRKKSGFFGSSGCTINSNIHNPNLKNIIASIFWTLIILQANF